VAGDGLTAYAPAVQQLSRHFIASPGPMYSRLSVCRIRCSKAWQAPIPVGIQKTGRHVWMDAGNLDEAPRKLKFPGRQTSSIQP